MSIVIKHADDWQGELDLAAVQRLPAFLDLEDAKKLQGWALRPEEGGP